MWSDDILDSMLSESSLSNLCVLVGGQIMMWRRGKLNIGESPSLIGQIDIAKKHGLTLKDLGSSVEEVNRIRREALLILLALNAACGKRDPRLQKRCDAAIAAAAAEGIDVAEITTALNEGQRRLSEGNNSVPRREHE